MDVEKAVKLINRANRIYKRAKDKGFADDEIQKSVKMKMELAFGKDDNKLLDGSELVANIDSKKSQAALRILNNYVNSPLSTEGGKRRIQRQRKESLMKKEGLTSVEANRFYKLMQSEVVRDALENLQYINYRDLMAGAKNSKLTVKKFQKAYDKMEKRASEIVEQGGEELTNIEKSKLLLKMITSQG